MFPKALFQLRLQNNTLQCTLCPHNCILKNGQTGNCRVRKNINGTLFSLNYGKITAIHTDCIEKKPLYHFFPGKSILSIGSIGCNLKCNFCQNSDISQSDAEEYKDYKTFEAHEIISRVQNTENNIGLAYTYNEPIIFYEFMYDIASEIKKINYSNVMVSNGFVNKEPLKRLLKVIDAFNIDLKGFSNDFYKNQTTGKLQPVLDTIETIVKSKKHIEITNLVIPTLNDDEKIFEDMINNLYDIGGSNIILHLSKYFPHYKSMIAETEKKKMISLYNIAKTKLNYVYLGNINCKTGQNTFCNQCGNLLIERAYYYTKTEGISSNGFCKKCNSKIENMIL